MDFAAWTVPRQPVEGASLASVVRVYSRAWHIHMKPRRLHRWIAWLLPLFVLRAFVPVGYMLAPSADGLQMVLCTGAGAAPMRAMPHGALPELGDHGDHAAHGEHAHHAPSTDESSQRDHSSAHRSSLCVFAVGGNANAPAPQLAVLLATPNADSPLTFSADPELNSSPSLIDRIRGPPRA